jgi:hypothetical protein
MPLPPLTSENSFSRDDRFSRAGVDPLGEIEPYLILHHLCSSKKTKSPVSSFCVVFIVAGERNLGPSNSMS